MQKSRLNTILLLIIIILLVIGLFYFFFNNLKQKENNLVNNLPQENQTTNNTKKNQYPNGFKEDSSTEKFVNQPGAIKSITANGTNKWVLAVDLLSSNTKWLPGIDSTGGPYINQNTKVRKLNVTSATKAYNCGDIYPNSTMIGPPGLENIASFINSLQNTITHAKSDFKNRIGATENMTDWVVANFDINGTNITVIYQSCWP